MLKLTPLRETASFQDALRDDRVELLTELIQSKFSPSSETMAAIIANLRKLNLESLGALFKELLGLETVEQLETWIANHFSETEEELNRPPK